MQSLAYEGWFISGLYTKNDKTIALHNNIILFRGGFNTVYLVHTKECAVLQKFGMLK